MGSPDLILLGNREIICYLCCGTMIVDFFIVPFDVSAFSNTSLVIMIPSEIGSISSIIASHFHVD